MKQSDRDKINEEFDRVFWQYWDEIREEMMPDLAEGIMELDRALNSLIDEKIKASQPQALQPTAAGSIASHIPWRKPPEDLRRLLETLIERGYIANSSADAVVGHFDIAGKLEPSELISWKHHQWELGALLAALADTGCLGPVRRYTSPPFPRPRGAPKWAALHFGLKAKSFYDSCQKRKGSAEGTIKNFIHLLGEAGIK